MLKNTTVDFDFYFVNKPGLRKFAEKGRVPYEFIFKPLPDGLGLTHQELGDRSINSDNITVFFVSKAIHKPKMLLLLLSLFLHSCFSPY